MNVERFLTSLSAADDDPARISQLRKIAVALAINGKLGAPELRPPNYPKVRDEELPADFNDSSRFTRLGAIARIEKGKTGIKQAFPGPFPLVVTGEERLSCDHFDFQEPAAIVPLVSSAGHGKASLNRLHYQEGKFALGTILAAVFPHDPGLITARFIFEYLSTFKDELLVSRMIGTANVSLSIGKVAEVPIPFVSRDAQRRLDELMALCDRLEAARAQREATRDRLTASTLARLNTPEPPASPDGDAFKESSFQSNARFALKVLPALTTRRDQIRHLRRSLHDLAMRGELTTQARFEGTAADLVKQLAVFKRQMIAAKTVRQGKVSYRESDLGTSGSVPSGWVRACVDDVCYKVTDGTHFTPRYEASGVRFVSAKDIVAGKLVFDNCKYISLQEHEDLYRRCNPQLHDIVISKSGSIGAVALIEDDGQFSLFESLALLKFDQESIEPEFLLHALRHACAKLRDVHIRGVGVKHLHLDVLRGLPLLLPPRELQRHIVVTVKELMTMCDQLEASLTRSENTRSRLLNALLHEALEPANSALEAA